MDISQPGENDRGAIHGPVQNLIANRRNFLLQANAGVIKFQVMTWNWSNHSYFCAHPFWISPILAGPTATAYSPSRLLAPVVEINRLVCDSRFSASGALFHGFMVGMQEVSPARTMRTQFCSDGIPRHIEPLFVDQWLRRPACSL
jgi:hypothetical protein